MIILFYFVGFKICFNNNAFVCRLCGARGTSVNPNICTIQDTDQLYSIIDEPVESVLAQLDLKHDFVFESLPNIHRFNCCPLDLLHDLAEGLLPNVLKFVFRNWCDHREELSPDVIISKINSFRFHEGKPSISTWNKQIKDKKTGKVIDTYPEFAFDSTGIQVCF